MTRCFSRRSPFQGFSHNFKQNFFDQTSSPAPSIDNCSEKNSFSENLFCSIPILRFYPAFTLKDERIVSQLPLSIQWTSTLQNTSQWPLVGHKSPGCVHKVFRACKDNQWESPTKPFNLLQFLHLQQHRLQQDFNHSCILASCR